MARGRLWYTGGLLFSTTREVSVVLAGGCEVFEEPPFQP